MLGWLALRRAVDEPLLSANEIKSLLNTELCGRSVFDRRPPERGRSGQFLSARKGSGSDIADLRSYQPGDSPRTVDWRASAKSRELLVRSYFSEQSKPMFLVLDRRESMRFGTRVRPKVAQAARVVISLAACQSQAGQELAAVVLDRSHHWLPPGRGATHLRHLIELANAPCPVNEKQAVHSWASEVSTLSDRVPKGARLVLVSDFSGMNDSHRQLLAMLGQSSDALAVHITDPVEEVAPATSIDLAWAGARQHYDASSAETFDDQLQIQTEAIQRQLHQAGFDYYHLSTVTDDLLIGRASE